MLRSQPTLANGFEHFLDLRETGCTLSVVETADTQVY